MTAESGKRKGMRTRKTLRDLERCERETQASGDNNSDGISERLEECA